MTRVDLRKVLETVIQRILALPLIVRPAALVLPVFLILHALLTIGANSRGTADRSKNPSLLVESAVPPRGELTHSLARQMIESSKEMRRRRQAQCLKEYSLRSTLDFGDDTCCPQLLYLGYAKQTRDEYGDRDLVRITIKPEIYNDLKRSLVEDAERYYIAVAARKFLEIKGVYPTPNTREFAKRLHGTMRVDFTWQWDPTGVLGRELFPNPAPVMSGHAYFHKWHTVWQLAEVEINDSSGARTTDD